MKNPKKYQYDIQIEKPKNESTKKPMNPNNEGRRMPKSLCIMIIKQFMTDNFPERFYAYDGSKILYTGRPLGDGLHEPMTAEVTINDPDRQTERSFTVTIKFSREIDFTLLHEAMQRQESLEDSRIENAKTCLQIIFIGNSARHNVIQSGNAFFHPTTEIAIGQGKIIKPGIGHTVILGSKAFLNLDMIYKIFPKSGSIIDNIIQEVCGAPPRRDYPPQPIDLSRRLNGTQEQELEEFIRGLKVEVKIPDGPVLVRSRVNGVKECASRNTFVKEGRRITVQQHFHEAYRYQLQHPELPCLWIGSPNQNYCYPIELCSILPNQAHRFRKTDADTKAIGNEATCNTQERARKIQGAAGVVAINPRNEYLRDFGVQVAGEFKQVESRILIHPKLGYRSVNVEVQKGQWDPKEFRGSNRLSNWCILVLDKFVNDDDIFKFKNDVIKCGRTLGMEIDPVKKVLRKNHPSDFSEQALENLFKSCLKDFNVQLIFVVLPGNPRDTKDAYSRVKKASEIKSSVLTSCIKPNNVKRINYSILKNFLIKVNTKLNGLNHILIPVPQLRAQNQWCIEGRTMILGADVTHPAPQDRQKIPSVAAVVASHDRHASLYNMEWSFQGPTTVNHEIIQNLKEMVTKQLKFYMEKIGDKPERLLFFRDGVSEGEFDKVRFTEIRAIKEACRNVCGSDIPLTFVVVQKRHRARFFPDPKDQNEGRNIYDKNRNVPAGTVVDTDIVRQDLFEFYLVSHASILGTARPTKYKTLLDESNISADELEHLTYYLCHMYNRCSRSVSYPAPTYYAHLACFRIRNYLSTERNLNMDNLEAEEKRLKGEQAFYLNNPLYFI